MTRCRGVRSRPGDPDRHQKCTGPERHRVTPLSTTGRYSTDPGHDPPDAGRFSHASETMCAYVAGATAGHDGDRPGGAEPVGPGPPVRPSPSDPDGTTGTCRAAGPRYDGPGGRRHVAGGRTPFGGTGLGSPGDALRPRPPRRGPGRVPRHAGARRGSRPRLLRGPRRGPRHRLGGTVEHGDTTAPHDIRACRTDGTKRRRGDGGRRARHGGTKRVALRELVPALGPTKR